MRKIVLDVAVTLDGFIEGSNGEIDWLVKDPDIDFGDILTNILADIDAIFYGRTSYDLWGKYQPDDAASPKIRQAYALLHSKKKYVFSTSPRSDARATFISSDLVGNVKQILQSPGKNIWLYGGANLITTFVNEGLVDIYKLAVHPVIIGSGKPLFQNIKKKIDLRLENAEGFKSGVTLLTYSSNRNLA